MFKIIICTLFLLSQLLLPVIAQDQPTLYKNINQEKMIHWVDSVFDKMTLDERIGQLFMITSDPGTSTKTTQRIVKLIDEQHIGGVLFSKGDVVDQVTSTNLYQKESKVPLFIAFDGEWGLSMRLENTPKFPRNMPLGAISNDDLLFSYGEEVGRECRKIGVHINFAPVLDVNCNPNNPVIGTRSFGENPQLVASKGIAYARGLESTGVIAVGKHFPGHGDTSDDSHKTLPVITHRLSHLKEVELYPFVQFINAGFSGIMSGHLSVPALDSTSGAPSSLSVKIVKKLLQDSLKFKGLTFTDALAMKGADSGTESICVQALLAGNDILLNPIKPVREFNAIKKAIQDGTIPVKDIEAKCMKILAYKYIAGLNGYKPVSTKGLESNLNSTYSEWLIDRLNAESVTLLKNTDDMIPLKRLAGKKIAVLSLGTKDRTDFQETISLYSTVDFFNISMEETDKIIDQTIDKLKAYDVIICGIHSFKMQECSQLRALMSGKDVYLCFFIPPYILNRHRQSILLSKVVVLAYEDTKSSQQSAAQVIMGGLPAMGKIPVTVTGLFQYGEGIPTGKTRLAYRLPEDVGMSSSKLRQIDAIVKEGLEKKAYPGCQVLVAKNGVVVYNKSFGYFDYARTHPVRNTDVYDLASVTKAAATIPAVMKLYDSKKIKLDDRLSNYITELKGTDKNDITIREALFHQTGLPAFLPFYQLAIDKDSYEGPLYAGKRDLVFRTEYDNNVYTRTDFKYKRDLVSDTPKEGFTLQVANNFFLNDEFPDLILKQIVKTSLKKKDAYLYSDLNFMLLKEVVESVSKSKLDNYLDSAFFAKLGASSLMFKPLRKIDTLNIAPTENDQFLRNQILIGFPDDETAAFMGGVSGNAGLFSNANDLAKLLQVFLNEGTYGGERFFSAETNRLFTKTTSSVSRRGLGFDKPEKDKDKTNPCSESTPASAYGHTGFTGTCFWVDPDNQLIYIFLSNRIYPSRTNKDLMKLGIRSRIQEAIYNAMD